MAFHSLTHAIRNGIVSPPDKPELTIFDGCFGGVDQAAVAAGHIMCFH
jgi:hypothetical protein